MYDDDEIGFDEFGGRRKKRKKRRAKRRVKRKARRKAGRGLARLKKIKKIGKPFKKLVTSKVFKKILSFIPVYGPAAVQAIEAGEAIAKKAKSKVDKVVDLEERAKAAAKRGDKAAVAKLKRAGEKAAREAQAELERLGKVKKARKGIARKVAARAKRGDPKAKRALRGLKTSVAERRKLDAAAQRVVAKRRRPSPVAKVPPGKVVVMVGGRRFTFDRRKVRQRVRAA